LAFDPKILSDRINFINKGIKGLMYVYGSEEKRLQEYANRYNIPIEELYSIRHKLRIQREIHVSKKFEESKPMITTKFDQLIDMAASTDNVRYMVRQFLLETGMPIVKVIRFVTTLPEFINLKKDAAEYLQQINEKFYKLEIDSHKKAMRFEASLVDYLKVSYDIPFKTENEIRAAGINVTPDILFDNAIELEVDGEKHIIRWIDAKNYILVNIRFIVRSITKQAAKYNDAYGMGAFVFRYGFDSSIKIPGVIMLDASYLEKLF
jgi:hypothetical protein